ncbi:MAG: M1 family metallopeptidase [Candidatus Aminicenantaceae bacterium]
MNKAKTFGIFLLIMLLNFLYAQEIPYHKSHKYDFRTLLLEAPEHNYDVLHYKFEWNIDFNSRYIQGKAIVRARSLVNGLNTITLHLDESMNVAQISQNTNVLSYLHHDGLLDIHLAQTYNSDEEFEVEITYGGFPQAGLNFSYHENQPIIWSLDEPTMARNWFPCYDLPSDKATAGMKITLPDEMIVASNGLLTDVSDNADGTVTYIWQEGYPIATYLISIVATNYEVFSDTYTSGSDTMEVIYYVYPEHLSEAREDFSMTVSMIEFYSGLFGEYPFLRERYGMAEIPGGTSMEHQTCTSYATKCITGTHKYDFIVAHELAHQWWGDFVTLAEWPDIWLNEGFATYSDALWFEHLYSLEGLKSRMADFKNSYLTRHEGQEHAIYDPPEGHLFCTIEYEKAAWVLHMLRFVVGDNNFWQILKKYAQDYAYDIATTEDFKSVCEHVYGADLDWFFNQWIYKAGYPTYEFGWGSAGQNRVSVVVNQVQEDFPLFKMPVELKFNLPSGTVKKTVWIDKKSNTFDFILQDIPLDVLFDPENWILCKVEKFQKGGKRGR